MRITIIKEDSVVGVDKVFYKVNLTDLPSNVRAVQYDSVIQTGTIEYTNKANGLIKDSLGFIPFNIFLTRWTEADVLAKTPVEPTPATLEETLEGIRKALQDSIDTKAKSFGFSEGNALMLYAGFPNYFQGLASVFATWESSVWYEATVYKESVLAGTKPMLTPNEAVALMPVYPT